MFRKAPLCWISAGAEPLIKICPHSCWELAKLPRLQVVEWEVVQKPCRYKSIANKFCLRMSHSEVITQESNVLFPKHPTTLESQQSHCWALYYRWCRYTLQLLWNLDIQLYKSLGDPCKKMPVSEQIIITTDTIIKGEIRHCLENWISAINASVGAARYTVPAFAHLT